MVSGTQRYWEHRGQAPPRPRPCANKAPPLPPVGPVRRGYRPHAYTSASVASCTFKSFFYKERRMYCSTNNMLMLRECFVQEVSVRDFERSSYQTASILARSASRSMHALLRARSKAARPSSHAMMASSLLFSSSSWACSSSTLADGTAIVGGGGVPTHTKQ
jgi:hypothetical protein